MRLSPHPSQYFVSALPTFPLTGGLAIPRRSRLRLTTPVLYNYHSQLINISPADLIVLIAPAEPSTDISPSEAGTVLVPCLSLSYFKQTSPLFRILEEAWGL